MVEEIWASGISGLVQEAVVCCFGCGQSGLHPCILLLCFQKPSLAGDRRCSCFQECLYCATLFPTIFEVASLGPRQSTPLVIEPSHSLCLAGSRQGNRPRHATSIARPATHNSKGPGQAWASAGPAGRGRDLSIPTGGWKRRQLAKVLGLGSAEHNAFNMHDHGHGTSEVAVCAARKVL
jgi:hypothetical protein